MDENRSALDELRSMAFVMSMSGDGVRTTAKELPDVTGETLGELADRFENEYVELPRDADGELWTGDERKFEFDTGERMKMGGMMYCPHIGSK